ncbi:spd-2 [Drosophila busckii]|uniref:Spd-2 n=2 Tax=Drosophila busckii TaxID=30019 RepID=A0A0M4F011_DROBS|nr:spd-2 [Drosophila busckii]
MSSLYKSSGSVNNSRDSSNVNERLRAGRIKAIETLEKPRQRSSHISPTTKLGDSSQTGERNKTNMNGRVSSASNNFSNISDLVTEETIDLNSSASVLMPAPTDAPFFFEPAEITGRSTLCKTSSRSSKPRQSTNMSVADILRSSFSERARVQYANRLEKEPCDNKSDISSLGDSFNTSRSLPRTADLSNMSLNGGTGISFGSVTNQACDESFAPAELMQSKLLNGEISWAQEFTAIPTATLSKQALQKIAAPQPPAVLEASISNSILAGDADFSLGNYFQMRSDNISNIVGFDHNNEANKTASSVGIITPHVENKTYTKLESAKLERNLMKQMHKERILNAASTKATEAASSSELLSLTAIDEALRNLNSDTSISDMVSKLRAQTHGDENKENETDSTLCKSKSKLTDTMSFTDSILNCTDFREMQKSMTETTNRQPLSPLADYNSNQPQILITNVTDHDADIDEWPSTPIKSPARRVRRTKSPNSKKSISPTSSDGVRPLPSTDEEASTNTDDDKTPVNKKASSIIAGARRQTSFCSTRLEVCDAVPSSTDCDFGISPNLGATTTSVRHVSPLSSPRSCLSSPLLDSTTSSERRLLLAGLTAGGVRKINSSPAGSEASSTSGLAASTRTANGTAPRSLSRCSNSSEFSHRDGKILPLKVTHTSLCWGSTKMRTDVRKSMQIKNTASKRLVLRICIQGPGFQLVNVESNTLMLQAMECRTISINFCPTVSGAAIGSISFFAPGSNSGQQPALEIPLYGYGGNASITIQGLLKGPVGASFLTFGSVGDLASGPLTASFKFYNKGPLTAFAGIAVDSTVLLKPRLNVAFEVKPNKIILPPYSEALVQIVFRPNREDIKNILKKSSQVLTLANMRIFCGDEPNRQRMRALVQRMTVEQREQLTSSMLDNIWCSFPGEQPIRNMGLLNEPPEFILDLVTVVRIIDVALTLNREFDESDDSSQLLMPDADETVLFRTVCAANSPTPSNMLDPVDEQLEADTTTTNEPQAMERENWSVDPAAISFDFSEKDQVRDGTKLTIRNFFRSRQYIEINCNVAELFQITPSECYIAPDGGQVEVSVRPLRSLKAESLKTNMQIMLVVSMESERINVPVTLKA